MLKLTVRGLDILRTAEELSTLNSQIRLKFPFRVPGSLVLHETLSSDSIHAHINAFMTTDTLRTSQMCEDLDTINFKDCFEVKWSKDMTTVFEARLPALWPVPPSFSREASVCTSTLGTRTRTGLFFQSIIDAHTQFMSDFDTGYPADSSDVWAPKATEEVEYPYHWFKTPVHFHVVHDDSFLGGTRDLESEVKHDPDAKTVSIIHGGIGLSKVGPNNLGTVDMDRDGTHVVRVHGSS